LCEIKNGEEIDPDKMKEILKKRQKKKKKKRKNIMKIISIKSIRI